jgi:hypothetical protein
MAPRVAQLIEEIKALPLEEQQLLRDSLAEAAPPEAMEPISAEEEVQRRLLDAGLIKEIKRRTRDQASFESYTPIVIQGKPLSETIIEERR